MSLIKGAGTFGLFARIFFTPLSKITRIDHNSQTIIWLIKMYDLHLAKRIEGMLYKNLNT